MGKEGERTGSTLPNYAITVSKNSVSGAKIRMLIGQKKTLAAFSYAHTDCASQIPSCGFFGLMAWHARAPAPELDKLHHHTLCVTMH